MKMLFISILASSLCMIIFTLAHAVDLKGVSAQGVSSDSNQENCSKPCECEYRGTITQVIVNDDLVVVATSTGPFEFIYKHNGKKECFKLTDLNAGEKVSVICKEKKKYLEATCIKRIIDESKPTLMNGTLQGGSIQ